MQPSGNSSVNRQKYELYVLGTDDAKEDLERVVNHYKFDFDEATSLGGGRGQNQIVIAACDFSSPESMQDTAKALSAVEDSLDCHIVVYAQGEDGQLCQEELLFAIELGSRFTAHGSNKNTDLVNYLQKIVNSNVGALARSYEREIEKFRVEDNKMGLKKVADKLFRINEQSEDILRLQAMLSQYLNLANKAVYFLQKLLRMNPQNLWGANLLGRIYLKNNRVSEGIEVLEKLSHFNDLNSERYLRLGNAYLDIGKLQKAEQSFDKGNNLVGISSGDERFNEGIAKVRLEEGNVEGALSILRKPALSEGVLSYLNMRAIMAIKGKKIDEALRFYKMALDGCKGVRVIRAKLYFNMGLAFNKGGRYSEAVTAFETSFKLGKGEFEKAKEPLEIARRNAVLLKTKSRAEAASEIQEDTNTIDDIVSIAS